MEELIKRLERVIATGVPDKDGMHPINAETVLEVVRGLSEHSTNLAEVGKDTISRQAAIDIIKELTITIEGYEMHNQAVMDYCAEIMRLPPIQPKRGKWESVPHKRARVCSCCGHDEPYKFADDDTTIYNFCPNCGADMREVTT